MFFLILIDKLLYKYRVLIYIAKNVCEAFSDYTVTSGNRRDFMLIYSATFNIKII